MANNPYVNKVVYDGTTLIDITDTTFDAAELPLGSVVYNAAGARVTGSAIVHHVYTDTTANWEAQTTYVPEDGDIIAYTDRDTITEGGTTYDVPGFKIGDGSTSVVNLPFVDAALEARMIEYVDDAIADHDDDMIATVAEVAAYLGID